MSYIKYLHIILYMSANILHIYIIEVLNLYKFDKWNTMYMLILQKKKKESWLNLNFNDKNLQINL